MLSTLTSITRRRCSGQASVEIFLTLIILLPLLFGAFEFSRAIAVRSALDSGVGIATRSLSLAPENYSWAEQNFTDTVSQNVFGTSGISGVLMRVTDSSGDPVDVGNLAFGSTFCVQGQADFTPHVPLLANSAITLRVRHCGIVERMD
jgi:Flp pilus assembly protein TadG